MDSVVSIAALKSAIVDELARVDPAHYAELLRLVRLHRRRKPRPQTGPLALPASFPQPTP